MRRQRKKLKTGEKGRRKKERLHTWKIKSKLKLGFWGRVFSPLVLWETLKSREIKEKTNKTNDTS